MKITIEFDISDKYMPLNITWDDVLGESFRAVYPALNEKYNGNQLAISKHFGIHRATIRKYVQKYIDNV